MIDKHSIEEVIKIAQEASASAEASLRTSAFEVILAHLLNEGVSKSPQQRKPITSKTERATSEEVHEPNTTTFDAGRLATQLGITTEQVEELYELKSGSLLLRIKPSGKRTPQQRRVLAEVLVVGYKFGLNTKTVAQSQILKAADEWNIGGNHFSRDVQKSKYVHAKAGGKGSDPVLSLVPGNIDEILTTVKGLLNLP